MVYSFDLVMPTGCWSCIPSAAVIIGSLFGRFLHSLQLCPARPQHKQPVLRTCLIPCFSDNISLILCQAESLVPADAVDLAPGVARRFRGG